MEAAGRSALEAASKAANVRGLSRAAPEAAATAHKGPAAATAASVAAGRGRWRGRGERQRACQQDGCC